MATPFPNPRPRPRRFPSPWPNCRWLSSLLALAPFLLGLALPARADRDIVYAARYYLPPGSRGASHFHLYRINPDGTGRRQLTFGSSDESDPHWSPDGRYVLFTRACSPAEGPTPPNEIALGHRTLCLMSVRGGRATTLVDFGGVSATAVDVWDGACWLPGSRKVAIVHTHFLHRGSACAVYLVDVRTRLAARLVGADTYLPSPDGKQVYVTRPCGAAVIGARGGSFPVSPLPHRTVWADARLVAAETVDAQGTGRPLLRLLDTRGRETRHLRLRYPKAVSWEVNPPDDDGWLLPSPRPGTVIYSLNEHNSTVGTQAAFFRVRLSGGAMHFLAEGQFLAWSPEGARFCTAPGRDTWTYREKRRDGTFKGVWAAPLGVGTSNGVRPKTITPGLVWVTGADWRRGTP